MSRDGVEVKNLEPMDAQSYEFWVGKAGRMSSAGGGLVERFGFCLGMFVGGDFGKWFWRVQKMRKPTGLGLDIILVFVFFEGL